MRWSSGDVRAWRRQRDEGTVAGAVGSWAISEEVMSSVDLKQRR
jgi:hypothetical protein